MKRAKPIVAWAEVYEDGKFSVYDLAPTKSGIEAGKKPTSRAVKVRIVPMEKRK